MCDNNQPETLLQGSPDFRYETQSPRFERISPELLNEDIERGG